jgi:biotin carboxyl carrier protein
LIEMEQELRLGQELFKVATEAKGGKVKVTVRDETYEVDLQNISENCLSLLIDGVAYTAYVARQDNKRFVQIGEEQYLFEEPEEEVSGPAGGAAAQLAQTEIGPPMPGKVVKFLVQEGQKVKAGQGLVIVEAMKMENEIKSTIEAIVKRVNFSAGDLVNLGDVIIELEPAEKSSRDSPA